MIVYVVTARFSTTIQRLIHGLGSEARGLLSYITYEEMFFERATPLAHHIFTDFDRLSRYELDCAATVALRLQAQAPEIRILNHPLHALERVPLLTSSICKASTTSQSSVLIPGRTYKISGFPARRGRIWRTRDGHSAIRRGVRRCDRADAAQWGALKGRIAVGYVGEPDDKGFYRNMAPSMLAGPLCRSI